MERIAVVFRKEVVDNLRDRRALASALLYPLLGPVLIVAMLLVLGRTFSDSAEKVLDLPVVGAENAPNLVQFLEQNNVTVAAGPADPEAEVKAGNLDVVLVIPPEYGAAFRSGEPATVRLVVDESRQSSTGAIRRVRGLLDAYANLIGRLRLAGRGVSPSVIDVLAVESVDLATPQSQAAVLLNITPYFIILSIFVGGMYLAIDTTAGEKERKSLEPLLTNPVTHAELILGKMAATFVFTAAAVVETLLAFAVAINVTPLEETLGMRLSLPWQALVLMLLISLPMMVLAVALQMIVASMTKGFKEAQTYLSLLPLIPALPGIFLTFLPIKPLLWTMLIPTFGQQLLFNQLMRGEAVDPLNVLISALVTLGLALGLVWVAIVQFGREKLILVQ